MRYFRRSARKAGALLEERWGNVCRARACELRHAHVHNEICSIYRDTEGYGSTTLHFASAGEAHVVIGTSIGASADWMEASGMLMLLDVFSEAWRSYVVWHVETVA